MRPKRHEINIYAYEYSKDSSAVILNKNNDGYLINVNKILYNGGLSYQIDYYINVSYSHNRNYDQFIYDYFVNSI